MLQALASSSAEEADPVNFTMSATCREDFGEDSRYAGISEMEPPHLVNAGRPLPIENVNHVPRISNEVHLQLSLFIDDELRCRV